MMEYILGFTGELAMADKQQLDDAVLEMLGIECPAKRRRLQIQLYIEVTQMYRDIRRAEKAEQTNRRAHPRSKMPGAKKIAAEIWSRLLGAVPENEMQVLAAARTSNEGLQRRIVSELQRLGSK